MRRREAPAASPSTGRVPRRRFSSRPAPFCASVRARMPANANGSPSTNASCATGLEPASAAPVRFAARRRSTQATAPRSPRRVPRRRRVGARARRCARVGWRARRAPTASSPARRYRREARRPAARRVRAPPRHRSRSRAHHDDREEQRRGVGHRVAPDRRGARDRHRCQCEQHERPLACRREADRERRERDPGEQTRNAPEIDQCGRRKPEPASRRHAGEVRQVDDRRVGACVRDADAAPGIERLLEEVEHLADRVPRRLPEVFALDRAIQLRNALRDPRARRLQTRHAEEALAHRVDPGEMAGFVGRCAGRHDDRENRARDERDRHERALRRSDGNPHAPS